MPPLPLSPSNHTQPSKRAIGLWVVLVCWLIVYLIISYVAPGALWGCVGAGVVLTFVALALMRRL